MTDKKERLIATALMLFANDGYNAVSTSRIAKQAGVSEGLIFRHFENKKGLLNAIMQEAETRLAVLFETIIQETDPREVIRKTINMPFNVPESEYDFWRLQYKLKWEKEYFNPDKTKPLVDKLIEAFQQLGYEQPEVEAKLLEQTLDSLGIGALQKGKESQIPFQALLLKKYEL